MKLAILGGTGRTGVEVIKQALEKGLTVTALVRDIEKAKEKLPSSPELTLVQGDALEQSKVDQVVQGHDAVIVSLGGGLRGPDVEICSKAQKLINHSVKKYNVRRMIVVSSIGVGDSWNSVSWITGFLLWLVLGRPLADKEIQEQQIREDLPEFDWTIVRPGQLTDTGLTGTYRTGFDLGSNRISRADVAHFILNQLESDEFHRQAPSIIY
ncbi:3-beta hydroxysteroid dehydrogenase/isomerase family [Basidiobolus meristosporus CBS 931.73]|uniref:3-beta hydroxysteroid dehydrogenase/isomerase family n=1 Tax=Basidiobolus meristosporus CBS 931.73 TaxID=1314790 RepID=A0A1Y1YLB3_9FUNG|nr:3-beta hydroxysteroid dehydrogenase/isomerase family [Basidiobolus meristosporus CBS 931.73]|eukprot:ORX98623.1 3-beta hydroxysteroid dehydrogenase/isomerase family [Basidiobolus meristosporus CBS 931.73]